MLEQNYGFYEGDYRYGQVGPPLEVTRKHAEFIHIDGHGIDRRAVNAMLQYQLKCQMHMLFDDIPAGGLKDKVRGEVTYQLRDILQSRVSQDRRAA